MVNGNRDLKKRTMSKSANFKVDPRLAILLGENYRSTELAIKELIDNSFDAEAEVVKVTFPEPFTNDPIIVADNGTGMTEAEVREEYLKIANSRYSRKGERTNTKQRLVKGRKGIGKFAGLMVAEEMEIITVARGMQTTLTISRSSLSKVDFDLEKIKLPIICSETTEPSGTMILLHGINDNLTFPNPEKFKQLLILEYGSLTDFKVFVNEEVVDIEDIPGETFTRDLDIKHAGKVSLKFTISDQKKALKQSGIVLRIKGKAVGKPQLFGLEESDVIPEKLQRRLFGEIVADGIADDVTADWGAIIENSKALDEIRKVVVPILEEAFETTYKAEVKLSRTRLKKRINAGLEKLPSFRQPFAKRSLDRIMLKFFGESEEKMGTVISIMLDAFEKDDYWVVIENLEKSQEKAPPVRAAALSDFGLIDVAIMAQQASNRLRVIDDFERLLFDRKSTVMQLMQALENNLWLLGHKYALTSPNASLSKIVDTYLEKKYGQLEPKERPTLLLVKNYRDYLLISVNDPEKFLEEDDISRSDGFRDDIGIYFPNNRLDLLILGQNGLEGKDHLWLYKNLLVEAKNQIRWTQAEYGRRVN